MAGRFFIYTENPRPIIANDGTVSGYSNGLAVDTATPSYEQQSVTFTIGGATGFIPMNNVRLIMPFNDDGTGSPKT